MLHAPTVLRRDRAGDSSPAGKLRSGMAELRLRPQELPAPELMPPETELVGYYTTALWRREDAIFVHPPWGGEVCAITRNVPVGRVHRLSSAVAAPRLDGPQIGVSIGVATAGRAGPDNWRDFLGRTVVLQPGGVGVAHADAAEGATGDRCDVLMAARVIGRPNNDFAWSLFRRFRFVVDISA